MIKPCIKLYKNIIFLGEGKKDLLLILAVPEIFARDSDEIVSIIENMQTDPNGKDKIKMLGLDGWQKADLSKTEIGIK